MSWPFTAAAISLSFLASACGEAVRQPADTQAEEDELDLRCDAMEARARPWCERIRQHRRPAAAVIDRIEERLARHPCVGDLARWQRLYSFEMSDRRGAEPAHVDETTVAFMLRQAGVNGFRPVRRVTAPLVWVNVDDRIYDFVSGSFNVASGKLSVDHCGPNVIVSRPKE